MFCSAAFFFDLLGAACFHHNGFGSLVGRSSWPSSPDFQSQVGVSKGHRHFGHFIRIIRLASMLFNGDVA